MAHEPRITDHDTIISQARADAGAEGGRMVKMSVVQLWSLIHRAPTLTRAERDDLGNALRVR